MEDPFAGEDLHIAVDNALRQNITPTADDLAVTVPGASSALIQRVLRERGCIATPEPEPVPPAPVPVTAPEPPKPPPAKPPAKPKPKPRPVDTGPSTVPKPKVPTREPKDQAEHMRMVFGSAKLRDKPSAHHAAMALHVLMGQKLRRSFGQPWPATRSLLATITGLSERGAGQAIEYAVECGFFRRVDDGNGGGKGKGTAAVYVPVIPDYGS